MYLFWTLQYFRTGGGINKAVRTSDEDRGYISEITFKDINAVDTPLTVELKGYDQTNLVENVSFENVILNRRALTPDYIKSNDFVNNVSFKP